MSSFFSQTVTNAKDSTKADISLFLLEQLLQRGVGLDNFEFVFSELGIFYVLPDGSFLRVALHKSIIDEKSFKESNFPRYHILKCPELTEEIVGGAAQTYRATHKSENRFFISIRHKGIETRFFNDKPLEICPLCLLRQNALLQQNIEASQFELGRVLKEPLFESKKEFYDAIKNRSFKAEIWAHITKKVKENKNNRCIKCNETLRQGVAARYAKEPKYGITFEKALLLCSNCETSTLLR